MSETSHPEPARTGKLVICPYCGSPQPTSAGAADEVSDRCRTCGGLFEPLSRQATHNSMGPWFVRDPQRPFQPGCSYETLVRLVQRGKISRLTIVRGPTTRQFWTIAKRVPGIAHLLGFCHECGASVDPGDHGCHACGVTFGAFLDRNYLGLPEYRPLPWEQVENSDDPRQALGLTHDDPSARTWHGLPTIRDTPQSKARLSSFATDEELRGGKAGAPASEVGVATQSVSDAPPTAVDSPLPATIESASEIQPEDRNAEVTLRLMRRRIARQRNTIQRLTLLSTALGLVTLISVISLMATLLQHSAPSGMDGAATAAQPQANTERESDAPDEKPEVASGHDTSTTDDVEAAESGAEQAATAQGTGPISIDPKRFAAVNAAFDRAIELHEASRDEDRPLADAIADCEKAIEALERIRNEQPREYWPDRLEDRIAEARRQHERLMLREFFP